MLTIAIQKSGRLSAKTIELLQDCGIKLDAPRNGTLKTNAKNFPLQALFLRDDDIPECVADAVADIGIVGENVVSEKAKSVKIDTRLGFGRCRLSIAVPRATVYRSVSDLGKGRIATSFPKILKAYLKRKGSKAVIQEISGSVEITPGIGMADAIFDIVSTGSTLLSNGLKEVEKVMNSEAVLIARPGLPTQKSNLLAQLRFRIDTVRRAVNSKYILLNAPNQALDAITRLLPGMNSPSIVPLAREGWSSLHSVIDEDDFWENIEQLRKMGAEGILIVPIEKMIL